MISLMKFVALLVSMLVCSSFVAADAPRNGDVLRHKDEASKTPNGILYVPGPIDCAGVEAKCLTRFLPSNARDYSYSTVNGTVSECSGQYFDANKQPVYTDNCYSAIPTSYLIECTAAGQQDSWLAVNFGKTSVDYVAFGKASARINYGDTFRLWGQQDSMDNVPQVRVQVFCPSAGM